jgi:ribokinase
MPTSQKPIVVVGSINTDLVAGAARLPVAGETVLGSSFQIHPGGKGANQAVAVSRLDYPVQLIGKVGADQFGEQARSYLQSAGVDISGVEVDTGTSGVAMIAVSPHGDNSIIVIPGANARVSPGFIDAHLEMIRGAGIVLTQLEIPIDTVQHLAEVCWREGIPLMLDPAPAQDLPLGLLSRLQWFTPNETEAAFFAAASLDDGDSTQPAKVADGLLAAGIQGVVLKMGARGSYLASANGIAQLIPPYPVIALDTTAAGDAFNGAFATALMLDMQEASAAQFASAAAAISVTRPGAQPSMPGRYEVMRLHASQQPLLELHEP